MARVQFSVCTTNYNCAHVLNQHLTSVFETLRRFDFEYLIVDNSSRDGSEQILRQWESNHPNMHAWVQRSTIGRGRQIAFERSHGEYILVLDTDVIYSPALAELLSLYLARTPKLAVQALYCGVFPRAIWEGVGGRRSLNTHEDIDMWVRVWRIGKMRWYPFSMGQNMKEPDASAGADFLSGRYERGERMRRLLRRHYDLWKTRGLSSLDLVGIYRQNHVDFGLGPSFDRWFDNRPRLSLLGRCVLLAREARQAWQANVR